MKDVVAGGADDALLWFGGVDAGLSAYWAVGVVVCGDVEVDLREVCEVFTCEKLLAWGWGRRSG